MHFFAIQPWLTWDGSPLISCVIYLLLVKLYFVFYKCVYNGKLKMNMMTFRDCINCQASLVVFDDLLAFIRCCFCRSRGNRTAELEGSAWTGRTPAVVCWRHFANVIRTIALHHSLGAFRPTSGQLVHIVVIIIIIIISGGRPLQPARTQTRPTHQRASFRSPWQRDAQCPLSLKPASPIVLLISVDGRLALISRAREMHWMPNASQIRRKETQRRYEWTKLVTRRKIIKCLSTSPRFDRCLTNFYGKLFYNKSKFAFWRQSLI